MKSYTANVGAHILRLPEQYKHVVAISRSNSNASDRSEANSVDTYISVGAVPNLDAVGEDISLPDALTYFASTLPVLNDAMCDIESYRLPSNDYRALLVLHDKLIVRVAIFMCFVSRFHRSSVFHP